MQTTRGLILIVDDFPAITDLVARGLSAKGFTCITADSSFRALRALTDKIDVVIVDYKLPDLDGTETLRRICDICECRHWKRPITVLISGYHLDLSPSDLHYYCIDHVLHKPFTVDDLLLLIE